MSTQSPYFLFMDLETTGLDEEKDRVLEWATILARYDTGEGFVRLSSASGLCACSQQALSRMNEKVREMHRASGLLEALSLCRDSLRPFNVQLTRILSVIPNSVIAGGMTLAGSSVHFDRKFIARDLPTLSNILHYRHFDTRVLYTAFKQAGCPLPPDDRRPTHRAMDDVEDSFKVAQWCDRFLRGASHALASE